MTNHPPCRHCGSRNVVKNGKSAGLQRLLCRACGRSFGDRPKRYEDAVKSKALQMYLNNVGIRKIAFFLGASPAGVLKWIRKAHAQMAAQADAAAKRLQQQSEPDIIEMDEIYTYVQKNSSGQSSGLLILGDKVALLRLK
jgi:hypothetical protein